MDEKRIIVIVIVGILAFFAGIFTATNYIHKNSADSDVIARWAIEDLDRANTYLLKGDNHTAILFLDSSFNFVWILYEETDNLLIEDIMNNIWIIKLKLEYEPNINITTISLEINKTIGLLLPYSDIPKYKDSYEEFEMLFNKYKEYITYRWLL